MTSSSSPRGSSQRQGATASATRNTKKGVCHRRRRAHHRFFLLLLSFSLLSSLSLASAQGTPEALVNSIGAATLAGQAAQATQAADDDAAAATNSSSAEAERQAKLDRVSSPLSAGGNIFVGDYQPYNRVVRRRAVDYVECRYNGTLTSRGVGIEESLPDAARLAFALSGDSRSEVAGAALAVYSRINTELAEVGFAGLAAALNSASSDVSLSPIKFVLPQDEGNSDNNNNSDNDNSDSDKNNDGNGKDARADSNSETPNPQYLVEVRVVLRSRDGPHLELGASTALEAAVLSSGEKLTASSAAFELSPLRLSQVFNAARAKANEDMLYALVSDAAQLGVLLGPLDEYAPERRQQVTSAADADAFDALAAAGGGRPSRLFAVVEVAASYQVCSGGLESKREFRKIDEDGYDIDDLTTEPTGP